MSEEKKNQNESETVSKPPEETPEDQVTETTGSQTADFIDEPAQVIEDKTKEAARKTSEIANQVLDKLKIGLNQAIAVGNKVFGEVSEAANHYAEQYKNSAEISRLSSRKDSLIQEMGQQYFTLYDRQTAPLKALMTDETINGFINQISTINDEIVRIGNILEENKQNRK